MIVLDDHHAPDGFLAHPVARCVDAVVGLDRHEMGPRTDVADRRVEVEVARDRAHHDVAVREDAVELTVLRDDHVTYIPLLHHLGGAPDRYPGIDRDRLPAHHVAYSFHR